MKDDTRLVLAFLAGVGVAAASVAIWGYNSAKVVNAVWGTELLVVEYKGVRYDTVPRHAILDSDTSDCRRRGHLDNRDFDIEYLVSHREYHRKKIEESQRFVASHEWYLKEVDAKLVAYRKMLGYETEEEPSE